MLLQFKDFECFSKSNTDVNTFLCDIKEAKWEFANDILVFTITASIPDPLRYAKSRTYTAQYPIPSLKRG